jgi:uncharacterized protein
MKDQKYGLTIVARSTMVLGLLMATMCGSLSACSSDPSNEAIRSQRVLGPSSSSTQVANLRASTNVITPNAAIPTVAPPTVNVTVQPDSPEISAADESSLGSGGTPEQANPTVNAGVRLAAAARSQVGVTTAYDPAYVGLRFPGGDVDEKTGVCSDVVVRALRVLGIDLQERLNLDMKAHFSQYPTKWGLTSPDPNIDHRRVPNLATYFARRGYELPVTSDPSDYKPGDVVWIKLPLDHIGIVSDRTVEGRPMLVHNVGQGTQEEDVLFSWQIVGHYRVVS